MARVKRYLSGGAVLLLALMVAAPCRSSGESPKRLRRGIAHRQHFYPQHFPFAHFPFWGGHAHPFPPVLTAPITYIAAAPEPAVAVAEIRSFDGGCCTTGRIVFTQTHPPNGPVLMRGNITGLTPGKHGLHIHTLGDTSNGCESMGDHYNPRRVNHGGPADPYRHVGDLGNIEADENGVGRLSETDHVISLCGAESILGRGLVIHERPDDLGRGGDMESTRTGNSGRRLACGIIGWAENELPTTTELPGTTTTTTELEAAVEDLSKRRRRGS